MLQTSPAPTALLLPFATAAPTISTSARSPGANKAVGVWSAEEHDRFLEALKKYPQGPWKAITEFVGTRSVRQVQTHAQKYQEKVSRRLHGMQTGKAVRLRREHRIDHDVLALATLISPTGADARRKHARRALDATKRATTIPQVPVAVPVVQTPTQVESTIVAAATNTLTPTKPAVATQRPTLDKVEPDTDVKPLLAGDFDGASPSAISSVALFAEFQCDDAMLLDLDMLDADDLPSLSESLDFFIENFSSI